MKILHTADLHLTEDNPERWDALNELLALAVRHKADILAISGDLFDQTYEAELLRTRLRSVLSRAGIQIIILPGNHDYKAYLGGLYYGNNVKILGSWEQPFRFGEAVFWGPPYEQISGDNLVNKLRDMGMRMNPDDNNIMLYHGELLDAFFSRYDMGDEGDIRYMPVKLGYFEPAPLQYVLAGHFHSRSSTWQLPGGGLFIYPGSPVSVTRRETGRRTAALITLGGPPVDIALDSYHYEELTVSLDPYSSADPLSEMEQQLQGLHPAAEVTLKVEGLYNGAALGLNETGLAEKINELVAPLQSVKPVYSFADVQTVLEDDLFRQFISRLSAAEKDSGLKKAAGDMAIRAFRVVK